MVESRVEDNHTNRVKKRRGNIHECEGCALNRAESIEIADMPRCRN